MMHKLGLAIIVAGAFSAASANAAITWTDWTYADGTSANGTLGPATVSISGPLHNWQVAGGTDYWRNGPNPFPAYDAVSNLPTNNDFVAPNGNGVQHVITFSQAVTNPYLAIISLGQYSIGTSWTFSDPFSIVDQGQGFWGNGVFGVSGNTLTAGEAHGIIQFTGTFTQITLTTNNVEYWSGLTIGADRVGDGNIVPEPATWAMLITGFGLVGIAARRRRKQVTA